MTRIAADRASTACLIEERLLEALPPLGNGLRSTTLATVRTAILEDELGLAVPLALIDNDRPLRARPKMPVPSMSLGAETEPPHPMANGRDANAKLLGDRTQR